MIEEPLYADKSKRSFACRMCIKEPNFFPIVLLPRQWSKVISESKIDLAWTSDGLTESRAHRPMANSSFLWTSQDKIMRSLSGD